MAELVVVALLGDPAAVEHHDLVDLVKPVRLAGDEQDGAAFGGLRQIGGHRLAGADGGDAWPVAVGRERD